MGEGVQEVCHQWESSHGGGEARRAVQGMELVFVVGGFFVHRVQVKGVQPGVEGQVRKFRRDRSER